MSDFSVFHVNSDPKINVVKRALVSQESCELRTLAKIGDLVDLALFIRLAIAKQICTDQKTLKSTSNFADMIEDLIKQEYPCFFDFDFNNPVGYFEAIRESSQQLDPELVAIFDSLFQKFRQVVDEVDSSDAADE